MRHRVDHRKLGRTSSHRRAMLRNMVTSLFEKERITTTNAKAKEAKRYAERLITRAKKGYAAHQEVQSLKEAGKEAEANEMQSVALAHWRQAARFIQKRSVLKKLFNELAPIYLEREGGYTRIIRIGHRNGDNAEMVLLELVGTEITSKPKTRKPKKKPEKVEEPEAVEAAADEVEGNIEGETPEPGDEDREKEEEKT